MARPKKVLSAAEIKAQRATLNAEYNAHLRNKKNTAKALKAANDTMTKAVTAADKAHKTAVVGATKTFDKASKTLTRTLAAIEKAITKNQAASAKLMPVLPAVEPIVPTVPTVSPKSTTGRRIPKILNGSATHLPTTQL